jgi:hypothetical protein
MPPKVPVQAPPIADDDLRAALAGFAAAMQNLPAALQAANQAAIDANQVNRDQAGLQNRPYPAPGSIPSDLRFTRTGTDPIQMSQNFRALESRLRILLGRFNEQLRRHCEHQVLAIRLDGQFTVWQRDALSRHLGQHVGGITNLLFNSPVPPPLPFANALWLHACTGYEAHHAAPLCPVTNIPLNDTPV